MAKTKNSYLLLRLIILISLVGINLYNCEKKTSFNSPHGSVSFGEKAYSPDDTMFAKEVDPYNQGRIGIFQTDGTELRIIETGNFSNDLKGLAWSPDSNYVAVMYHYRHQGGGGVSRVAVYNVKTGECVATINAPGFVHEIRFSNDGQEIILSGRSFKISRDNFTPKVKQ
ncbi:MAG: hypothetical protein AB1465_05220 [Patescibacteria group bacterium]